MTFREKLRKLRKTREVYMKELSRRTGIKYDTIVTLERKNKDVTPTLRTVIKLAKFFEMSIEELIAGVKFK